MLPLLYSVTQMSIYLTSHYSLNFTARNSDINGIMFSMKQLEDRFNKKFQYDYVFLNEQPFDQSFKE